eukprot:scaffold704_cov347-Prasinococcus_capsulatus_cf.AAC.2
MTATVCQYAEAKGKSSRSRGYTRVVGVAAFVPRDSAGQQGRGSRARAGCAGRRCHPRLGCRCSSTWTSSSCCAAGSPGAKAQSRG